MRSFITATSLIAVAGTASTATPFQTVVPAVTPATVAPGGPPADPKAAEKAAKIAAKLEAKRQRELHAKYGDGPYPDEIAAYADAHAEMLRPLYRTLYTGGERNAVLNFERLGLAAFEAGQFKDAAWALDQALARIETIYANNPQAGAARSIFHNEANKDFKGEPYERAMAYYYRGLLYLRDGDYGNANASFKNAEYQDTVSETEQFQSDFAVMNYLMGWSQRCQGRDTTAKEYFALATKAEKGLVEPEAGDNVLFISELGNGPVKARDSNQAQKLLFQGGEDYPETIATVTYTASGTPRTIALTHASSVTYQATTRGGRAIDGLMDGKANWKEGTSAVGTALMAQGMMNNNAAAGGYMQMAGALFSVFSSAMKTRADIRAWDGLPDRIMVGTAKAAPGWSYATAYAGEKGAVDLKGAAMRADAKSCSIVWTRSRPATYSETIVGEDDGVAASQNKKKPVQEKNKLFRAQLREQAL
jgi:tetratricopeptide (TPR) repeat protein